MLSQRRPEVPADFVREGGALRERLRIELETKLAKVPFGDEQIGDCFKRHELWRDDRFKSVLAPAGALLKCGYCERYRDRKGELHVDHYRPKAEVHAWEGDPPEVLAEPPATRRRSLGYWWLAWHWPNYVLACWTCNTAWKRNLFPLDGSSGRPLLLHPFEPFEAGEHFAWDAAGIVRGVSAEGSATIRVCGLNRSELVAARCGVFRSTLEETDAFVQAWRHGSPQEVERREARLYAVVRRDAEFAGMIRWIVGQQLSMSVEEFFGDP